MDDPETTQALDTWPARSDFNPIRAHRKTLLGVKRVWRDSNLSITPLSYCGKKHTSHLSCLRYLGPIKKMY